MQKYILILILITTTCCDPKKSSPIFSDKEKASIKITILNEIEEGIKATRTKDIDQYMNQIPDDLVLKDENGGLISKIELRKYALRDWAIIDTTLNIEMNIDSIQYLKKDSVIVYTFQIWERKMFQKDGIATDTVLTTQKHRETWKKNIEGWFAYYVEELGGEIFLNGVKYEQ